MSRLGAFLVQEGILTAADRQIIKRESAAYHGSFARSVLAMGLLDEDELSALMATKTGCQQVAKDIMHELDPSVGNMVPLHVLTWLEVLPLSVSDGLLRLAMVDPTDQDAMNQIKFFTGLRVKPMIARLSEIHRGLASLGAPVDLGESGFEGLLRTLGRPPIVTARRRKPQPNISRSAGYVQSMNQSTPNSPVAPDQDFVSAASHATEHGSRQYQREEISAASDGFTELLHDNDSSTSEPDSSISTQQFTEKMGDSESATELLGDGDERAVESDLNNSATVDLDAMMTSQSDGALPASSIEVESEIADSSDELDLTGDVSLEAVTDEVAAENKEASQADVNFTLPASEPSAEELTLLEEADVDADANVLPSEDEAKQLDDVAISLGDVGSTDPLAGQFEPKFEENEDTPAESQPEISALESSNPTGPGLDPIDLDESDIESSSHLGIADLNRVLISLQVTTDVARALTKVADVACRVGVIEGALVILRDAGDLVSVRWSKNASKSEVYLELPVGHDEASIRAITNGKDPDVWFSHEDSLSQNITHGMFITHGEQQVVCLAAFVGSSKHEGLQQTFADVIRALPVT